MMVKRLESSSSIELKLDVYDPLNQHFNDSSGAPLITFKLQGTHKFKKWFVFVKLAINTKTIQVLSMEKVLDLIIMNY